MELRWNSRYESAKPRLVRQLEALMRSSDESCHDSAKQVIAAVRSLPMLEEHRGTLRIENRAARRVGDSDFIYSLSVDDAGFVLSYHERMMIDSSGQRDNAFNDTIVECRDAGDPDDDESLDEETLANMREGIEMTFGVSFTESEWQEEIEAASAEGNDTVPNGIIR